MTPPALTETEQQVVTALASYHSHHGTWPTVRALADHMEQRFHRSERFSDDEVRGDLERAQAKEAVAQYADDGGRQRYCITGQEPAVG